jgi:hypothetical protein
MIQKNMDKIIIGTALTIAASALLPIAKSTLQPIAAAGFQRARSFLQIAREEVEDIIAEAQFERMKQKLDKEIEMLDNEEK